MSAVDIGYADQSRWSRPGRYRQAVDALPGAPDVLPELLAGLMIHRGIAPLRQIEMPEAARSDGDIRSVEELLACLLSRDASPLSVPRKASNKLFVVCRHFSLVATSFLRSHGIAARARCGFADYFAPPNFWGDHWVCEYHDGACWRLLDAQLDSETRTRSGTRLPAHDVPREHFIVAAEAWQRLRAGEFDEGNIGLDANVNGKWFVAASVLRDCAALAMEEMQAWDTWGPGRIFDALSDVPEEWLAPLDALAAAMGELPEAPSDARAIWVRFPWAALTPTVLSYPQGEPVEDQVGVG